QIALNAPGLVNNSLASSVATGPVFLLRSGFPADFLNVPHLDPAAGQVARLRVRAVNRDAPKSTTYQFSGGVEHDLGRELVVSADVVGTQGRHLASLVNLNQR